MRSAALVVVSVCVLAACNPNAENGGGAPSSVFPDLNGASYRIEANIIGEDSQTLPIVMIRDGQKMRIEMTAAEGTNTVISDIATGETVSLVNVGGRTMALRMTSDQLQNPAQEWQTELAASATMTGPCTGAGETGAQWSNVTDGHNDTVCVTSDGIILSTARDGRTTWETTSVQRGPQSADLFTLPPGVEVTDLGDMGAAMEQAMERARAAAGQ